MPGQVETSLRRLSEKWLDYYWPLFVGEFIPQSKAEAAGSPRQLGFRRAVTELMQPYRDMGAHGGLTAWHLDLSGGTASSRTKTDLEFALRAIDHAIRYGPVHHAGGALQSGRVFEFDPTARQVVLSADLWREFSLLGHWIVDAVVLRWAELTERFGHRQGIRIGPVLSLLIAKPELARATSLARGIFVRHQVQRCVWSDRRLAADDLAVDHVIPFSLWGCNDLWNLMPTHSKVNCQKSDKLPGASLLRARQDKIIQGWQLLRDEVPAAFDRQASHLLGRSPGGPLKWESELFTRLREAIEVTALQRGVERWEPAGRTGKSVFG